MRSREPSQSSDWLTMAEGGTQNLKLAEKGRLRGKGEGRKGLLMLTWLTLHYRDNDHRG